MRAETEALEFKRLLTDDVCKEVVAFATTLGGRLCIGVDDDGKVVGVEDPDVCQLKLAQKIESNIIPDVRPFVSIGIETVEGKTVVCAIVSPGDRKPYCLARKGFVPSGVFIHRGSGCQQASYDTIRFMMRESDGDVFESRLATRQDLTFDCARAAFRGCGLPFERENMVTLGFASTRLGKAEDPAFTNLGLLFSDQCEHTIKCAVFKDDDGVEFSAREEFGGSILQQVEDAFKFVQLNNNKRSRFDGIKRVDSNDYPTKALREGMLNAVAHRDYEYRDSILVKIYPSNIEIVSLGGLVRGFALEDIRNGVSALRNRGLANVLYRLNLIEAYGTGIRTIYRLYEGASRQPHMTSAPNSFALTLPNMNKMPPSISYGYASFKSNEQKVIECLEDKGMASRVEIEESTGLTRNVAIGALKGLRASGMVVQIGQGPRTQYALSDPESLLEA